MIIITVLVTIAIIGLLAFIGLVYHFYRKELAKRQDKAAYTKNANAVASQACRERYGNRRK